MEVKRITPTDTHKIRKEVLRRNSISEECIFPHDEEEQTFHLGAFDDGKLSSIASFYLENNSVFQEKHEYQFRLRGMATLDHYRGQGFSSQLLKTAFPLIKNNHINLLWCNARTSAKGFYEKVGFVATGDIFEIEDVGPHILMSIEIK